MRIDEMLGTDALGYLRPERAVWQPRTRRRCRSRCIVAAAPCGGSDRDHHAPWARGCPCGRTWRACSPGASSPRAAPPSGCRGRRRSGSSAGRGPRVAHMRNKYGHLEQVEIICSSGVAPTQKRQSCWFYEPLEQHADGRMLDCVRSHTDPETQHTDPETQQARTHRLTPTPPARASSPSPGAAAPSRPAPWARPRARRRRRRPRRGAW